MSTTPSDDKKIAKNAPRRTTWPGDGAPEDGASRASSDPAGGAALGQGGLARTFDELSDDETIADDLEARAYAVRAEGADDDEDAPSVGDGTSDHGGTGDRSDTFTRAGHVKAAPEYQESSLPRLGARTVGAWLPEQIAARKKAGRPPTRQENIDSWHERKAREAAAAADASDETFLLVQEARHEAATMMDAPGAPLLHALHIAGRKRWRTEPRYSKQGLSQEQDDILYLLEYLPPEVEWAFWIVDRDLIRAGDGWVPRSAPPPSLALLHEYAEGDALYFAAAAKRQREDSRTRRPRDRTTLRLAYWHLDGVVDSNGDLVETFVPCGYSLRLWGRPRHEPASPTFHLKRSERNARLEDRLAGQTIKEYIAAAATAAAYSFEEFVARPKRGNQSSREERRRAALAQTIAELRDGGATQQCLADATGLSQKQVSRLEKAHLQGK